MLIAESITSFVIDEDGETIDFLSLTFDERLLLQEIESLINLHCKGVTLDDFHLQNETSYGTTRLVATTEPFSKGRKIDEDYKEITIEYRIKLKEIKNPEKEDVKSQLSKLKNKKD